MPVTLDLVNIGAACGDTAADSPRVAFDKINQDLSLLAQELENVVAPSAETAERLSLRARNTGVSGSFAGVVTNGSGANPDVPLIAQANTTNWASYSTVSGNMPVVGIMLENDTASVTNDTGEFVMYGPIVLADHGSAAADLFAGAIPALGEDVYLATAPGKIGAVAQAPTASGTVLVRFGQMIASGTLFVNPEFIGIQ